MRSLYLTNTNQITISDVHLRLLAWLDEHEGVPTDVMATMLGIKSTTLVALLDDLTQVGLLGRLDPPDGSPRRQSGPAQRS